ncbi:GPI alpha-1,2-mannosyltransferase 3-like [Mytilus galloprovincialis]|uniref:GPI alpha-1,2-mannosyltransferase 3-like n=1 Tax=Mytilus galloprovincialis TaxID=29158 RepID=UPI003F7B7D5A
MTKDGKGSATIRRRKIKHSQDDLNKARTSCPSSPITSDDEQQHEVDEEEEGYLFEDEILGPSVVKKIMSSEKTIFLGLLAFRISNALLIQTSFVPDEYWQSLEVAHNMSFGYGYLTWEWKHGLRGYLYPFVFSSLYKFLYIFGLDSRLLLIKLPRILQGVFAAFGDLYLFKLSWKLTDRATAQWSLFCQVTSWFMFYCITRTLTNSMETVLVTVALYYYPWPKCKSTSLTKFLVFASLSVLVRPTAAIIWLLMCSWHLQQSSHNIFKILKQYFFIGSVMLVFSCIIDRWYYGDWILVQYNFIEFNVLKGGGSFYGTHPWHWYITQGYPVIMTSHLFPFVMGAWKARNKVLLFLIVWTIFFYSFLSHKEFRFLLPALPMSMHYCGVYFNSLCRKPRIKKKKLKKRSESKQTKTTSSSDSLVSSDGSTTPIIHQSTGTVHVIDGAIDESQEVDGAAEVTDNTQSSSPSSKSQSEDPFEKQQRKHKHNLTVAKYLVFILIGLNLIPAMYFGVLHQRGTTVVMKYLYDESLEKDMDVLFLMPCHSTPYYSYLHQNITMRFLTCEPNLKQEEDYIDEADIFYEDPEDWLKIEYKQQKRQLPSHLVYFNTLQFDISLFLSQSGYRQCGKFFHTHLPEGRTGSHVIVSCR